MVEGGKTVLRLSSSRSSVCSMCDTRCRHSAKCADASCEMRALLLRNTFRAKNAFGALARRSRSHRTTPGSLRELYPKTGHSRANASACSGFTCRKRAKKTRANRQRQSGRECVLEYDVCVCEGEHAAYA
eukprot:4009275-Pleurochrysis_carterae.AAC.2